MPAGPKPKFSFFSVILGLFLTNLILITTAISYPFFRQGSSYMRLNSGPPQK
jgi:hypothetical protein